MKIVYSRRILERKWIATFTEKDKAQTLVDKHPTLSLVIEEEKIYWIEWMFLKLLLL